jgi:hypothetical protein
MRVLQLERHILRTVLPLWLALISGICCLGAPIISEFMAANDSWLADEDGDFSDWIEIHNPGNTTVSLAGYHLTDHPAHLDKWTFPAITIDPGAFLVLFASGKNRADPASRLHTDFQLSAEGDYLALVAPDAATVVSAFAPLYPPQYPNVSFGISGLQGSPAWSFFANPTPGASNSIGTRAGPIVQPLDANPPQPVAGPLTIMARVLVANDPVATVKLFYRRMFGAETVMAMRDDGAGADAQADDGIWTAVIPETAFVPGEMTRWRFVVADSQGTETKEPAFRAPLDSAQYFGTVTQDARIASALPVMHWFTTNAARADTTAGSRGSVYYEGEFYDNVLFKLHGQSSAGFPKKSYNLDFNRTHHFRWSTNAPRVADIDLLTNWADKSKTRHVLAYEVMRRSGVAAHFAFTVRVQQNGNFFSTADFVEDADEIYLERAGLNKEGALYKVYDNLLNKDAGNTGNSGVEKKTRQTENNSDLQSLINGLDLTGSALKNYLYDNIDIPACVNMLAVNSVIRNIDMHSKNWYIYRDTGKSGEWAMLPWDLDLSFGRVWNTQNTYFDNALYTDDYVITGTSIRLVSHLFENPDIRAMIMRRIRTLTDRFLQPPPAPETPESDLYFERRLNELSALIDPPAIVPSDARLDFEKWGSWLQGGVTVRYTNANAAVETMTEAIQRWKTEYLPARRKYIYNTQIVGRGGEIPLPQTGGGATTNFTPLLVTGAQARVLVPANSNLGETWTGSPSLEPFNTGGWISGVTGVGYERSTGYETLIGVNVDNPMKSNNSVYVRIEFNLSDPAAFDRLQLRMKFDDGFAAYLNGALLASANSPAQLQWNSAATASHEANAAAFSLYDVTDKLPNLRAGRNILAIQGLNESLGSSDLIIVPELYGGNLVAPTTLEPKVNFGTVEVNPASGNQDEEFVLLTNPNPIAVDISDWRLAGGIEHTFRGGTVLPPNGAIYVSPNVAAFRARSVSPKGGEGLLVQGSYQKHLSNFGETLTLIDASGATNNSTSYQAQPSDAQRYLVISELMYHPAGDGLAEFVELLNISSSVTLNLRGVRFTRGVEFDFSGGAVTSLSPGGRLLVVRDLAAFSAAYGTNLPVAGVFTNGSALSNSGELIKLEDASNGTIREFTYNDKAPWPNSTNAGYSLVLITPESNPDHALAANWRLSSQLGGNPGRPDLPRFPANPFGDANENGELDLIDYMLGNDLGLLPIFAKCTLEADASGGQAALWLSYPVSRSATSAEINVVFSTDLITWQDAAAQLELVSQEPLDADRELVTWRVKPPLRNESRIYLRLRAVAH